MWEWHGPTRRSCDLLGCRLLAGDTRSRLEPGRQIARDKRSLNQKWGTDRESLWETRLVQSRWEVMGVFGPGICY